VFEKILYPTDFSNDSKKAVAYIKHLKKAGTREVIVLHVIDQKAINAIALIASAGVAKGADFGSRLKQLEKDQEEKIEPIVNEMRQYGFNVKVKLLKGSPLKEILKVEEEEDPSVIVIGSHRMSNIEEILIGSVSEKVIRWCKKPVLVIKR
jgi:nucleotide-binding universal stress UspA family protein